MNVGRVVQIQRSGSRASLGKSNGRLEVSRASSNLIPEGRSSSSPESIDRSGSSLNSSVNLARGKAEVLSVAFLTRIDYSVTAFRSLAFSAASIRSIVGVVSSIVAFLSNLNDSISANGPSTSIHGSVSNSGSGLNLVVDGKSSMSGLRESSVGSGNDISEGSTLGGRQQFGSGQDEPLNSFSARRSSFGSDVGVSTNDRGQQSLEIDQLTADRSTTSIQSTDRGTASGVGVRVSFTQITLFVVGSGSLSNTITTEGSGARGRTSERSNRSIVAFFIRISHAITTSGSSASGWSTSVSKSSTVSSTIVTIFNSLFNSITTVPLAARASIIINVVAIITFLTTVDNTVTTVSIFAVSSASIGSSVTVGNGGIEFGTPSTSDRSGITLFTSNRVNNTITTKAGLTIHSASVRSGVRVSIFSSVREFARITVITHFSRDEGSSNSNVSINVSGTASEGTVGEAIIAVNSKGVTIFSKINNTITARSRLAGSSAVPGSAGSADISSNPAKERVTSSVITRLAVGSIDNAITTSP